MAEVKRLDCSSSVDAISSPTNNAWFKMTSAIRRATKDAFEIELKDRGIWGIFGFAFGHGYSISFLPARASIVFAVAEKEEDPNKFKLLMHYEDPTFSFVELHRALEKLASGNTLL
jgi:hypothetical protein